MVGHAHHHVARLGDGSPALPVTVRFVGHRSAFSALLRLRLLRAATRAGRPGATRRASAMPARRLEASSTLVTRLHGMNSAPTRRGSPRGWLLSIGSCATPVTPTTSTAALQGRAGPGRTHRRTACRMRHRQGSYSVSVFMPSLLVPQGLAATAIGGL
jgi:hypothetical protein